MDNSNQNISFCLATSHLLLFLLNGYPILEDTYQIDKYNNSSFCQFSFDFIQNSSIEHHTNQNLYGAMVKVANTLTNDSIQLDGEIAKILNDNFVDLL